ncbi:uncharacterized protein NECHADRAFT_84514 [Fusarium vanettenii 77-13-4]|uniref:Uncharacterized protein n=1 Tax=Fusarium vanettenii (strain ATCC MYA-4622 / CBS 123669 / FGSC 9596 / NRRL 45880 / 77-13-4) TaxID=660122 RepID=C7ZDB8_FUSV7|nr:uncharacterized protein NECHADRAFT_84514 [Fusarium vanettenii 77-13-4]EEU38067.1 predicted protein [Fusarium vanettenii 77-13-4]
MSPVPNTVGPLQSQNPWSIDPNDVRTGVFSYAILGLMLLAFFGMIAVDMFRKHRTGELQESMSTLGNFIKLLLITMPKIMLDPRNMYKAWILFTDQFRKVENKRYDKKKESDKKKDTPEKEFDSEAIIKRMHSMSSSDKSPTDTSKTSSKGKEKEPFFTGPLDEVKLITTSSSSFKTGINLKLGHGTRHGSSSTGGCGAGSSSNAAGRSGSDFYPGAVGYGLYGCGDLGSGGCAGTDGGAGAGCD